MDLKSQDSGNEDRSNSHSSLKFVQTKVELGESLSAVCAQIIPSVPGEGGSDRDGDAHKSEDNLEVYVSNEVN
ncbi:hypothetical protein SKAU_G00202080 [Synaphobranchus kaupii]|uniref:Uncharacterized protein n=1 Tax=Synaphobranchus kaupii TaxID=118154 RepID=A0A9Q1IXE5_SYNKA|nr:hypothetical protein SKAU_G00202080 [Synaphobranchus kaupii]